VSHKVSLWFEQQKGLGGGSHCDSHRKRRNCSSKEGKGTNSVNVRDEPAPQSDNGISLLRGATSQRIYCSSLQALEWSLTSAAPFTHGLTLRDRPASKMIGGSSAMKKNCKPETQESTSKFSTVLERDLGSNKINDRHCRQCQQAIWWKAIMHLLLEAYPGDVRLWPFRKVAGEANNASQQQCRTRLPQPHYFPLFQLVP
jgi:hypothetical protein